MIIDCFPYGQISFPNEELKFYILVASILDSDIAMFKEPLALYRLKSAMTFVWRNQQ